MKQEMTELVAEVLIETYWNVKSFAVQDHLAGLCINRNILECKVIRSTRPSRRSVY